MHSHNRTVTLWLEAQACITLCPLYFQSFARSFTTPLATQIQIEQRVLATQIQHPPRYSSHSIQCLKSRRLQSHSQGLCPSSKCCRLASGSNAALSKPWSLLPASDSHLGWMKWWIIISRGPSRWWTRWCKRELQETKKLFRLTSTWASAAHPVAQAELRTDHSVKDLDSEDCPNPAETTKPCLKHLHEIYCLFSMLLWVRAAVASVDVVIIIFNLWSHDTILTVFPQMFFCFLFFIQLTYFMEGVHLCQCVYLCCVPLSWFPLWCICRFSVPFTWYSKGK